jgi:hypothetical protein
VWLMVDSVLNNVFVCEEFKRLRRRNEIGDEIVKWVAEREKNIACFAPRPSTT